MNSREHSISSFFTAFAQFVDHDLSSAANGKDDDGQVINCECQTETPNPFCLNIPTPDMPDQLCMVFARSSAPFQKENACQLCKYIDLWKKETNFCVIIVVREQVNQINSYLDASMIYGNNKNKADELRTLKNGLLRFSKTIVCRSSSRSIENNRSRFTTTGVVRKRRKRMSWCENESQMFSLR